MDCPICFDCIRHTNTCTTECGHTFHLSCFMQSGSSRCPLCRFDIVSNTYPPVVNDDTTEVDTSSNDSDYEYEVMNELYRNQIQVRRIHPIPPLVFDNNEESQSDSPISVLIDMDESAQHEFPPEQYELIMTV